MRREGVAGRLYGGDPGAPSGGTDEEFKGAGAGGQILAMDDRAFLRVALISGVIESSTESGREKNKTIIRIIWRNIERSL